MQTSKIPPGEYDPAGHASHSVSSPSLLPIRAAALKCPGLHDGRSQNPFGKQAPFSPRHLARNSQKRCFQGGIGKRMLAASTNRCLPARSNCAVRSGMTFCRFASNSVDPNKVRLRITASCTENANKVTSHSHANNERCAAAACAPAEPPGWALQSRMPRWRGPGASRQTARQQLGMTRAAGARSQTVR